MDNLKAYGAGMLVSAIILALLGLDENVLVGSPIWVKGLIWAGLFAAISLLVTLFLSIAYSIWKAYNRNGGKDE